MEILSIGEKIKRARIYKGLTLKDICDDKVSVSKMSCIENCKIKAEDWIIDFIAKKLELSIEYLRQDIDYQLRYNIEVEYINCKDEEKEKLLKYNLQYAEGYKYYDMAFKLQHLLFEYYINKCDAKACLTDTSKYYNLLIKSSNKESRYIYYIDIGRYFYLIKEYSQATNYFSMVRNEFGNKRIIEYCSLAPIIYEEVSCYYMLGEYENAFNIARESIEQKEFLLEDEYIVRIYGLLTILSIKLGYEEFKEYEKVVYDLSSQNMSLRAEMIYNFGKAFFEKNVEKEAYLYIKRSIDTFPKEDKSGFVQLMINVIDVLIKMNKQKKAEELTDVILNYAIYMREDRYIEKAYYFKALLVSSSENIIMQEMYMNLSLDVLLKYGNQKQIYERYMEMGSMYFKMENTREALKYFGLALQLNKVT